MNAPPSGLSRREREIMDVIFKLTGATISDLTKGMTAPPTRSTLRSTLIRLVEKGHIVINEKKRGREFVYLPTLARNDVGRTALKNTLNVYFDGSLAKALAVYLSDENNKLSEEEAQQLRWIVDAGAEESE